jgi:hypothetical protein
MALGQQIASACGSTALPPRRLCVPRSPRDEASMATSFRLTQIAEGSLRVAQVPADDLATHVEQYAAPRGLRDPVLEGEVYCMNSRAPLGLLNRAGDIDEPGLQ